MPTLKRRLAAPLALFALLAAFGSAVAQTASPDEVAQTALPDEVVRQPSADGGRDLADKLCTGCHLIAGDGATTAQVGPPPFKSIANKPGQTVDRIKNALMQPHPPMPDMQMTNDEMLDIITYLDTLRTDKSAPSLLPPGVVAKPRYPAPS